MLRAGSGSVAGTGVLGLEVDLEVRCVVPAGLSVRAGHIKAAPAAWGGNSHKDREEQAQLKKRRFGTPWRSSVIFDQTKRRDQKWASLAELYQKHERALSPALSLLE